MPNIKLNSFGQPYWTGTWTSNVSGTFSGPEGARSYFMKQPDKFAATDAAWIRKCDLGWAVVFDGTVLETHPRKDAAQRAAEDLHGLPLA